MATVKIRAFVVFEMEGDCPECVGDLAPSLGGGRAYRDAPNGNVNANIISVVVDDTREVVGDVKWCLEHQQQFEIDENGDWIGG